MGRWRWRTGGGFTAGGDGAWRLETAATGAGSCGFARDVELDGRGRWKIKVRILEGCSELGQEAGEMVYKSIPDDAVVHRIVAVDDTVSQADDEVDFVDFGLGFGIKVADGRVPRRR